MLGGGCQGCWVRGDHLVWHDYVVGSAMSEPTVFKNKEVHLRVPYSTALKVASIAEAEDRSISSVYRRLINQGLGITQPFSSEGESL